VIATYVALLVPFSTVKKSAAPPSRYPFFFPFPLRLLCRRLYYYSPVGLPCACLLRSFVELFFQSKYGVCAFSSHSLYVSTVGLNDGTFYRTACAIVLLLVPPVPCELDHFHFFISLLIPGPDSIQSLDNGHNTGPRSSCLSCTYLDHFSDQSLLYLCSIPSPFTCTPRKSSRLCLLFHLQPTRIFPFLPTHILQFSWSYFRQYIFSFC